MREKRFERSCLEPFLLVTISLLISDRARRGTGGWYSVHIPAIHFSVSHQVSSGYYLFVIELHGVE